MSIPTYLKRAAKLSDLFGFSPVRAVRSFAALPRFAADMNNYRSLTPDPQSPFPLQLRNLIPMLHDRNEEAGSAGQYFIQDLWAARKVFERKPTRHLDIGSRIDGFVGHLLVFMPVTVVDIRPFKNTIPGLQFLTAEATGLLQLGDGAIDSVSSLHAAEHFGLGRYGDRVDPSACFKFMRALARVLSPGGRLYFSVPVGRERLHFNAHRIFDPGTVLKTFKDLELVSFAGIDDANVLHDGAEPQQFANARHGCGLFEFSKSPITVAPGHGAPDRSRGV